EYWQGHNKAVCLFDPNRAQSLGGTLCARSNVDCLRGLTTWGNSQGAALAAIAGSYDARVRPAFLTGFGQGFDLRGWTRELWLQADRIRLFNAEHDQGIPGGRSAVVQVNNEITSVTCADSPCLLESGGGW